MPPLGPSLNRLLSSLVEKDQRKERERERDIERERDRWIQREREPGRQNMRTTEEQMYGETGSLRHPNTHFPCLSVGGSPPFFLISIFIVCYSAILRLNVFILYSWRIPACIIIDVTIAVIINIVVIVTIVLLLFLVQLNNCFPFIINSSWIREKLNRSPTDSLHASILSCCISHF